MRTGATLGLGGPAQPKLEVSRPQDPLERQADKTADTVMRSSAPAGAAECIPCAQNPRDLQRAAATPEPPIQRAATVPEPPIQRAATVPEPPIQRAAASGAPPAVPPKTAALIRSPGPGKPIPPDVRQRVEPGVGADLGGVRVHDGPAAVSAAMSVQAKAFTHGPNIFLGPRQSSRDVRLMAHESTHVVQQGAAVQRTANDQPVQRTADEQAQRAAVEDQAQRAPAEEQVQRACAPCDEGTVQRTAEPTVQRSIWSDITGVAGAAWNAAGELVDAAGNVIEMGAEMFWKLAQEVLPGGVLQIIDEIRSQGIVGYLSSHLRTVFNAVFGGLRGDNSALGGLVDAFDAVLAAAPAIVEALKAGDCQPLFSAVSQLGEALGTVAGEAWDAIAAFFRPIGDFFSELWASFGAPVVDWLVKYAKDQWEAFKKLGQMLWDLTQPVRDELAAAWTWLKNQLGIGEGEEGQNGILQWVQTKAGEAWDAIKAELQPIIGPMQAVVDKIKAVLPITAILNLRETVRGWLSGVQGMVGNLQQPQGVVANQDTLRSEILPAVRASILGLRGSLTGAGAWIAAEIGGLVTTVTGFLDSLRSNSILSAAAGLFDWIGAGVARLGAWAQATVGGLVGFLSDGLGKLSEFIEPVLNTLQKVVAVLGDVIGELPGLVLGPFWRMIPECIREPIKNFIIEHILKNIPIINKFLEIPDIWSKIQALVLDLLKRLFVNGDLTGAAMAVIRFVLEAAGVNVDLLLGVIAKAAASLEDIIMDPVKFLGNLFAAMKQGLDQFLTNIGQHLINGLLTWMLGPLADLGIKIPTELSLASVLDLVLQILGITGAKLRQKAEKVIGKTAVKVLEQAWKYISALIEGGPAKLWEEIKNQLSTLWDAVIGGITSWISMEVVEAGIAWIAKLSNPVGAVIEAIRQIYNVVRFVVEQANKIIAFADAVVSSLGKIVSGEIGGAANWIEEALGRTVPLVIDFLAGLVGISSPSPHIRKIVEKIQGTVDKALDWLVEKAKAIGQGLLSALGLGGPSESGVRGEALAALSEQLTSEHTVDQARDIVAQILTQLRPKGLKRLELGQPEEDGDLLIMAEASPFSRLAKLKPINATERKASMNCRVELTFGTPVDAAALGIQTNQRVIMGPGGVPFKTETYAAGPGGIQTGSPVVQIPANAQKGAGGTQAVLFGPTAPGGAVILPTTPTAKLQVRSWNTGSMEASETSNGTHAEHQFVGWISGQTALKANLVRIEVFNAPYSPCTSCAGELGALLASFPAESRPQAVIEWTKVYESTPTLHRVLASTPGAISGMAGAGWQIVQPSPLPAGTQVTEASGTKGEPYVIDASGS